MVTWERLNARPMPTVGPPITPESLILFRGRKYELRLEALQIAALDRQTNEDVMSEVEWLRV